MRRSRDSTGGPFEFDCKRVRNPRKIELVVGVGAWPARKLIRVQDQWRMALEAKGWTK